MRVIFLRVKVFLKVKFLLRVKFFLKVNIYITIFSVYLFVRFGDHSAVGSTGND